MANRPATAAWVPDNNDGRAIAPLVGSRDAKGGCGALDLATLWRVPPNMKHRGPAMPPQAMRPACTKGVYSRPAMEQGAGPARKGGMKPASTRPEVRAPVLIGLSNADGTTQARYSTRAWGRRPEPLVARDEVEGCLRAARPETIPARRPGGRIAGTRAQLALTPRSHRHARAHARGRAGGTTQGRVLIMRRRR